MKSFKGILLFTVLSFLPRIILADDPVVPPVVDGIFGTILKVLESIGGGMVEHAGVIGVVLGVLFSISKVISNEKAPWVVSKIQLGFDLAARALEALGAICKKASEFLANLVKSDGILGKK